MKAVLSLLALVAPAFAEELLNRGGGGEGWGGGGGGESTTTEVVYTTSMLPRCDLILQSSPVEPGNLALSYAVV